VATPAAPSAQPGPADALTGALRQLLAPLARLALARGVTQATLDELLKQALVDAADRQYAELPPHRRVSRISTATGINRREVTRLVEALREGAAHQPPPQRSLASELFAHWRTDRLFCDRRGSPAELPRQGPAPSFEALAQTITRDVHPRSLLDEMVRLGMAAHDRQRDTVRLLSQDFVPRGDASRMLRAMGNNVGDHLQAAVDNVLAESPRHFEQAIFADGLSAASVAELDRLVRAQWGQLADALVPALEALLARDAAGDSPGAAPEADAARQRVRLGLYSLAQDEPAPDAPESPR
jgi:hypothetical protein